MNTRTAKYKENQKKYFKSLPQCCICLNKIGKKNSITTECGHKYHSYCLDQWLELNNSCPYCRADLQPEMEREEIFFWLQEMMMDFLMDIQIEMR